MINKTLTTAQKALLMELKRREEAKSIEASKPQFNFESYCFAPQRDFFRSPGERFRVAVCSRRAGKTIGIAADAIDTCLKTPNAVCLYITITSQNARNIIWGDTLKILEEYDLECKIDNTRLSLKFPNGSRFIIAGAKDRQEIEKYRGWKLTKCYIDECQSFRPYIEELVNDIITPALRDLRGNLYMTGTPGPVPAGYFYTISTSDLWTSHKWTAFDNPHLHNPAKGIDLEETLAEERRLKGIDIDNASYQRETYGRWVEDKDALVFKFNKERNIYYDKPTIDQYIFGIDIGYNDADSIAVLGYNDIDKKVYIIEEVEKTKQDITSLVQEIKRLQKIYNPIKMVMDAGALGKKIQEEILQRHSLKLEAAEKHRKIEFIELLNDDLRNAKLLAAPNSIFEQDSYLVTWDRESKIKNPENPKISSTYHSDSCFTPDMTVVCKDGVKRIVDVKEGDLVLTHKGRFRKVLATMSRKYSGNLLKLNVKGIERDITVTPNHEFYASTSKRCYKGKLTGQRVLKDTKWTPARELTAQKHLQPGHYLQAPEGVQEESVKLSNDMCFLIGYYLAEGSLGGNGSQVSFACHKDEVGVKEILTSAIESHYPAERAANSNMTKWRRKHTNIKPRKRGAIHTRFGKGNSAQNYVGIKELHRYLRQCSKSTTKIFPEDIYKFSREQATHCLIGYYFGDGHVAPTGIKSSTISKHLAAGLKYLWSLLGIGASECKLNKASTNNIIEGYKVTTRDQYNLTISKQDSLILINRIESDDRYLKLYQTKRYHKITSTNNKQFNSLNYQVNRVQHLPYSGTVYNLEVEEDNSYTIEGMSVHNCDATLYAWRECKHFLSEAPAEILKIGSDAYMDDLERKEAERVQAFNEDPDTAQLFEDIERDFEDFDEWNF